jgi:1,4-dihydroxy-2-naphthoate octaprenyltransferase
MHDKNPLHMILALIVLVLAVFGIWNHDWTLIIVAIVVLAIKKCLFCCCHEKARKRRK